MKKLLLWLTLVPVAAIATSQPQWNPDGDNLYRLFRIDEPSNVERGPVKRIKREFDALITQTEGMNLPVAEARARLAVIEGGKRILGAEKFHSLYDTFLTALSNRRLHIGTDFKLPTSDPHFQGYLPTTANPLAEGKGAGMAHYVIFNGYWRSINENPELKPTNLHDLCRGFDKYLVAHGVTGFSGYIEPLFASVGKVAGIWDTIEEHGKAMRLSFAAGVATCAVILGSWQIYDHLHTPAPQRLDQIEQVRQDPKVEADEQARKLSGETVREILESVDPGGKSTPTAK